MVQWSDSIDTLMLALESLCHLECRRLTLWLRELAAAHRDRHPAPRRRVWGLVVGGFLISL